MPETEPETDATKIQRLYLRGYQTDLEKCAKRLRDLLDLFEKEGMPSQSSLDDHYTPYTDAALQLVHRLHWTLHTLDLSNLVSIAVTLDNGLPDRGLPDRWAEILEALHEEELESLNPGQDRPAYEEDDDEYDDEDDDFLP